MKAIPSAQKLRGGYYTPAPIAQFLADWAIQKPTTTVLEPSCGDGVFFSAAVSRLLSIGVHPDAIVRQLTGVELDTKEVAKVLYRTKDYFGLTDGPQILVGDFFSHCQGILEGKRYDAVLGNPPFIRYQNFPEMHREAAFKLMRAAGLHPTRLTNAWLPFVVLGTELLTEHGRIAMVVPAELLQVNYAAELRQFLSDKCVRLTLFTFRQLVFDGIQQEIVLLCGERDGGAQTGIRTIELEDLDDLKMYQHTPFDHTDLKPMDHSREKWTQYFLTQEEIYLLRRVKNIPSLQRIGQLADVEVGIVTGMNDFFVLRKSEVESINANGHAVSLVARSGHLKGAIFNRNDWKENAADDLPAYLLNLPDVPVEQLPDALSDYIQEGERKEWHKGFKCRIRNPWYRVPSVWIPDAFMLRQIHNCPRIIVNNAKATCTDTIHRVRVGSGVNVQQLAASAFNSLTFAFSEVLGRSYGGGVLELEPREAEDLPVPYDAAKKLDLEKIDVFLREGKTEKALEYCDDVLLVKGVGLKRTESKQLNSIWNTLRSRRTGRKRRVGGTDNLRFTFL